MRLKLLAVVAVLAAACAVMAPPPGGPDRRVPPALLGVFPDSGCALADLRRGAEFRFDEVIGEGGTPNFGTGTGGLERLVLLSPDTAVPQVTWQRDRISVRPKHGWRPDRVYRIELAPGVTDLHNNVAKSGGVVTVCTGSAAPTRFLIGRAVDWGALSGAARALVTAFHLPDSLGYRTVADSNGRFRLGPLPDGTYLVEATLDANQDHKRQSSEPWDTVRVDAKRDSVGEIWAFTRDTLPPKIRDATRLDSQSISVVFTKLVDPHLHLDSTSIRVREILASGDSGTIGPIEAYAKAAYDSIHKAPPKVRTAKEDSVFRRDSLRADSVARANPVRPVGGRRPPRIDSLQQKRPPLGNTVVIRTRGQVRLGRRYVIELSQVRSVAGVSGPPVSYTFDTPKPPTAADSAKAKAHADSVRTDSIRTDSVQRARAGTPPVRRPDSSTVHRFPR